MNSSWRTEDHTTLALCLSNQVLTIMVNWVHFVPHCFIWTHQEWDNGGAVREGHLSFMSRRHSCTDVISPSIHSNRNYSKKCGALPALLLHLILAPTSHFVQKNLLSLWLGLMFREGRD